MANEDLFDSIPSPTFSNLSVASSTLDHSESPDDVWGVFRNLQFPGAHSSLEPKKGKENFVFGQKLQTENAIELAMLHAALRKESRQRELAEERAGKLEDEVSSLQKELAGIKHALEGKEAELADVAAALGEAQEMVARASLDWAKEKQEKEKLLKACISLNSEMRAARKEADEERAKREEAEDVLADVEEEMERMEKEMEMDREALKKTDSWREHRLQFKLGEAKFALEEKWQLLTTVQHALERKLVELSCPGFREDDRRGENKAESNKSSVGDNDTKSTCGGGRERESEEVDLVEVAKAKGLVIKSLLRKRAADEPLVSGGLGSKGKQRKSSADELRRAVEPLANDGKSNFVANSKIHESQPVRLCSQREIHVCRDRLASLLVPSEVAST